jgi:hypothetical protein
MRREASISLVAAIYKFLVADSGVGDSPHGPSP